MMDTPVQQAVDSTDPNASPGERALVRQWQKVLETARKADEGFRKQVMKDRAVADGSALQGYEVKANICQAIVETLTPFLYAKDPDVDVVAEDQVSQPYKPRTPRPQMPQAAMGPDGQPMMAPDGQPISPDPMQVMQSAMEMQAYQAQMQQEEQAAEQERIQNDYIRRLAQTIEIVVSRLWRKAHLKTECKKQLRGALTSAEGWLKVSIQGDLVANDTVQRELYTLRDQLAQIDALEAQLEKGQCADVEGKRAQLMAMIEGAEARVETYVARCLAIDWVDTLDMQWPKAVRSVAEYTTAPWGADRTFYSLEDACAEFGLDKERLANAVKYREDARETSYIMGPNPNIMTDGAYEDDRVKRTNDADSEGMVCCWEVHSRKDNMIYTWIEGTDFWAKEPRSPRFVTTRFYPYFLFAPYQIDGKRHGESLVGRLAPLQQEYAITRSNFAEVRRRAKPGVLFDSTNMSPEDMAKIASSENQEFVPVAPLRPGEPLGNSFTPKPYANVNPALYDTQPIRGDMETISGAQEALSQGITVAKTATEAEIQQMGSNARTSFIRDELDDMLSELARYTAELALQAFNEEQVRKWAGPHAVWPQGMEQEDLESLVYVAIRAGSTGKPNTSNERRAWGETMPVIQALMEKIGLARGADALEMADKLTELLRETVQRAGDKIDVDRFLPMPSPQAQMGQQPPMGGLPDPMGGAPAPMMQEPEQAPPAIN